MPEIQEIPRNPDDSVVSLTWAEGGSATEPSAGRKDTGFLSLDVVSEEEMNWLSRDPMRFVRALYGRYPNASEALFTSWLVRNGVWANGINPLEGFLSDSLVTDSLVADVWVNPPDIDTGATRVQVSVPKASPHTFPATRDTYVFVPVDLLVPPTATTADLTFLDVPVGDPAPATPAGTEAVWRVETDGTSIVDQEVLVFVVPAFKDVGTQSMFTGTLDVLGNASVAGNLDVLGNTTLGDTSGDTLVVTATSTFLNMVTLADDLVVDGLTFLNGDVDIGNAAGDAISVLGTMTVTPAATFNGLVTHNANIDFGANTITGAGGTVTTSTVNAGSMDTGSSAGTVRPGIIYPYTDATPSALLGRTQFNGSRWSVGDGAVARTIYSPIEAYVVSDSTTSSIDDIAGASVSLLIGDNEWVIVTLDLWMDVSTAGEDPTLRIAATNGVDNVSILNTGDGDAASKVLPSTAANGDDRPARLVVRWKPTNDIVTPNNTNWTIRARHGVTGAATLTSTNVLLSVRYE